MKSYFKIVLFVIYNLIVVTYNSKAQTYPVQLSTSLIPPYSGYLADYADPSSEKLKVILQFNDFTVPQYNVRLKFEIKGNGFTLTTKQFYNPPPLQIEPGVPFMLSGADIAPYLNSANLDFVGINQSQYEQHMALPEGYYSICVKAYDYYNSGNVQVSNEACAQAWFTLSDPPFLNLPLCNAAVTPQTPQNLLFQWTPMNMGSPNSAINTEYLFELWECRPDSNANPNQIVQSTPPIYSTTTQQTLLNYGLTEPPLNLYMKYVWRVKAQDVSGRDLFKNNGYSQICTFNYGSVASVLGNALSLNLTAQGITHRLGKCTWNTQSIYTSYKLQVRKKGTVNWFDYNTTQNSEKVTNLEPNTEYEAQVQGIGNGITSAWSNIASFTTNNEPNYNCNDQTQLADPLQAQPLPIQKAIAGLIIQSGQFEVVATQLLPTGAPGWYSGKGYARVFGLLPLAVEWQNIYIDDNNRHQQGVIQALTKGVNTWLHQWDVAQATDNAGYVPGTITGFTVNPNGQYCYTLQGGSTEPICAPTPTGVNVFIVRDDSGNQYTVQLIPPPPTVTGPTNYLQTSTDELAACDSLQINFAPSPNQNFGFDKKEYAANIPSYECIKLSNGQNYFVPYKSIGEGQTDEVYADVQITNFKPANLTFKTQAGITVISTSVTATQFKLTGINANATCVYAYYNNKKIAKLNVVSLKPIAKKLVIVPVNNAAINSQTQTQLNSLYKQANVTWSVTTATNFNFDLGNDGLEAADATLLAKYSTEMRALRDAYKQANANYDKDAYYIFVVPNFSNSQLKGYMVRGRALGFVTANASAKEVAHELAHGAFGLEHTFPKIEQSTTDNLLDYGNGEQLTKVQWDEMRNPSLLPKWEDSEEDASYQTDGHYSTIYLIGKMLGIQQYKLLAWYTEYPDNVIHDKYAIVKTTWAERDHQLATHALTNGYHSVEEFKTAIGFLNADENNYQEMGRLLHRYGDCYAHTRISTRLLEDSLKMMYGMPTMIYLNGKIYFLDYTLEHMSSDKAKPDIIANDPNWYLKYVENVADLLCVKFNKQKSNLNLNLFQDLANYAKQKNVSLIGIIDYEIAKMENKKTFFIKYPMPQGGNLLSNLIVPITERDPYIDWIKNTEDYLKSKNIQYTISWQITYNVQGLEVINAPAKFTIIYN